MVEKEEGEMKTKIWKNLEQEKRRNRGWQEWKVAAKTSPAETNQQPAIVGRRE